MTTQERVAFKAFDAFVIAVLTSYVLASAQTINAPRDPGVRGGPPGAGSPLPGLTADESAFFKDGLARFADVEVVTGGIKMGWGLGSTRTSACHATRSLLLADQALRGIP